ncbi:mitochondrial inner membrane protease subunit 2 isoform X2 [Pangasianodon hypophthalmus]|uniref:mitochondrial inner membrane protease subunit 2 isoform X2 n=1 Tax=Pangasianodon hypophthalmus TaxID=310915 RepID=UPI000EFE0373|nr:mitochondrial inner membrane protease subunit 2 isoform X2 [Pangasianodon hypophthalmus]
MAQTAGLGRKYLKAFVSGFFVAVPVTVTVLDRLAYVARVEGASMQPSLNPEGALSSDVVLLNRWSVRNYEVRRGDIVSVVSPKNPKQKIIKRVIALEGDFIKFHSDSSTAEHLTSYGLQTGGSGSDRVFHLTADLCSTGEDLQRTTVMMTTIKNDLLGSYTITLTLMSRTDCLIVMAENV